MPPAPAPFPVSTYAVYHGLAQLPLGAVSAHCFRALHQLVSATVLEHHRRRHARACSGAGLDARLYGSISFAKLDELAPIFLLDVDDNASGKTQRDVRRRLEPLEAAGLIQILWREAGGSAKAGVLFIGREQILAAARGEDPVWPALDQNGNDHEGIDHAVIACPYIGGSDRSDPPNPPPGGDGQGLRELELLLDEHTTAPKPWAGPRRHRLQVVVERHGLDACFTALRGRSATAPPLTSPVGWLDVAAADVAAVDPLEAKVLESVPRWGSSPPMTALSDWQRRKLRALVESHGEAAVIAALDAGAAAGERRPVQALARYLEGRQASREERSTPARPRRRRETAAERRHRQWAEVGAHPPRDEAADAAPVAEAPPPTPDPAASEAWAAAAPPPRLTHLVPVALLAGGIIELTTGDEVSDLYLAMTEAAALAELGAVIRGSGAARIARFAVSRRPMARASTQRRRPKRAPDRAAKMSALLEAVA